MAREEAPKEAARKADRLRVFVLVVSAGALLLGVALHLGIVRIPSLLLRIPLEPLVVSPELTRVPSLPAGFGSLAGRNVLVVTLDTTRPDRIGCYGNREIETPNLDRLASDGVVFSKAVATASSTLPAHGSIFTGLYPHRHGARANALFHVGEEQRTLAEILAENGYETAAFVSSFVLDGRFGLAQGFDVYDDDIVGGATMPYGFAERRGDHTTDRAIGWLRSASHRPFFLWVHYFDPHTRYTPPQPFASRYRLPYDGEIAFVDQQLGRLLEAAESAAGPELLVVVTADHGESLGEHGEETHAFLLQEATLQIPLILYARQGLRGGVHVDTRASQVDLMPTILALLGIDAPEGLDGVDLALPPNPNRPVLAETVEGRVEFGWARLSALYQGPLKVVDGRRLAFYDLSRDPLERSDLSASRSAEVPRLRRRLEELRGAANDRLTPTVDDLGAAEIERLAALGYVVTGGETVPAGAPGPDPREVIHLMSRLLMMLDAAIQARNIPLTVRIAAAFDGIPLPRSSAEAIRELEKVAAEHPDFVPVHHHLSILYEKENRPDDARRAAERRNRLMRSLPAEP